MKIYLVNFATQNFYKAQKKLAKSALRFGVDQCISYNKSLLTKTEFYKQHRSILDQERGAGYWLWKPFIILETLRAAEDDDIVIYSDSGAEIIAPLDPLVNLCQQHGGILLFNVHIPNGKHTNIMWTKRDCFVLMDADEPRFHNAEQVAGSPQLYQKTPRSLGFLEEWLNYCTDERILTDIQNCCGLDNYAEFKDHRHDQSVLSLLAVRHGLETFRDPSQFGNHLKLPPYRNKGELATGLTYSPTPFTNSPYDTLFHLHRERNFSLTHRIQRFWNKFFPISAPPSICTKTQSRETHNISIGITTFGHRFEQYFVPLLSQLRNFDPEIEIVVAINGEHNLDFSEEYREKILQFLATQPKVFPIFFPQFRGVAKLWNTIVVHASHDYILMLNDDLAVTTPHFVQIISDFLKKNRLRSFTVKHSFSHFLIARDELDTIGYFDERLLGIGEEDGDFVWRYMEKFGEPLQNADLDCFKNLSQQTAGYKIPNIASQAGSKYSRFNRDFMFREKYEPDINGIQGMFDFPVRCKAPSATEYPNEKFYRRNKNKL
ncbi:MAG: glycosyltransferase [Desulfobulbaceae bacterium]|nr:glycosyltransferase [Desulfobulbaceae bacterium]HIJ91444.1 glycosyltransferase family 2 protein [Deltaproteobacteria bacterium]